jgi:hypothetical protein
MHIGGIFMDEHTERNSDGRFKKGVCPNPRGRPRKDRSISKAILDAANEMVVASHGGRKRKMPKVRATATQIANKGIQGDLRAGKMLLDYAVKAEAQQAAVAPAEPVLTQSDQEILDRFLADYRRSLGLEVEQ